MIYAQPNNKLFILPAEAKLKKMSEISGTKKFEKLLN